MPNLEHNSLFRYFFNRELSELYLCLALRFFALSLIGIFIPIYLLKEVGLSLEQVIILTLFSVILFGITIFPAAKIASKYGAKHIILISIFFLISALLALMPRAQPFYYYILPSILLGINFGFFWIGYHIDFAKFSSKKSGGKQVALADIVSVLASILGPVAGGIIATYIGFAPLFILAAAFLVASVIPLFKTRDIKEPDPFSFRFIFQKQHIRYLFGFLAQGTINQTSELFWPIFIFLILQGYYSLGIVASVAAIAVALSTYIAGALSDRKISKSTLIHIGALAYLAVWIVRAYISTEAQVVYLTLLGGIIAPFIGIPFLAKTYEQAKKEGITEFILFREFIVRIGAIAVLLLVLFIGTIKSGFIFTALSNLLFLGL